MNGKMRCAALVFAWYFIYQSFEGPRLIGPFIDKTRCEITRSFVIDQSKAGSCFEVKE